MEDHGRKGAVPDTDELADQATHQRLLRGFRREEEEYNRSHLLYGDDHIERAPENIPGRK
ncbi:MAG: hypothetical protein FIB02_05660 [Desulfuromonas sp.]|nr:hypothetical protein [Desulfuromonas sp.]